MYLPVEKVAQTVGKPNVYALRIPQQLHPADYLVLSHDETTLHSMVKTRRWLRFFNIQTKVEHHCKLNSKHDDEFLEKSIEQRNCKPQGW